jgi:hypothetical protein
VDQSPDELIGMLVHDALLPVHERDPAVVLATGPVLREQAWPVLPVRRHIEGSRVRARVQRCPPPADVFDCERDPPGDVDVHQIASNAEAVDPAIGVDEVTVT